MKADEPLKIGQFNKENLEDVLENKRSNYIRESERSDYITGYAQSLGCTKMCIEKSYVDQDYLDDYSGYYSQCFNDYPRFCQRLHLFTDIDARRLRRIILEGKGLEYLDELQLNYLGSIVVRPLPELVIGRTMLRTPLEALVHGEDAVNVPVIRCVVKRHANMHGINLSVDEGAPFQEQDQSTGMCATSALWTALQITADRFNHTRPTRYMITKMATDEMVSDSRSFPQTGLTVEQMCQAIKRIGLEPELTDYYHGAGDRVGGLHPPFLSLCHSFLRAKLPIILGLALDDDFHAVTVVGYRLGENRRAEIEDSGDFYIRGARITHFIVHDDQFGPYTEMVVRHDRRTNGVTLLSRLWKDTAGIRAIRPTFCLVPVAPLIRVRYQVVLEQVYYIDQYLIKGSGLSAGSTPEWEVYLCSINEMRDSIVRMHLSSRDRKRLLMSNSPKWFWRAILYLDDDKMLELFFDATDMEPSCQLFRGFCHDPAFGSNLLKALGRIERESPLTQNRIFKKHACEVLADICE